MNDNASLLKEVRQFLGTAFTPYRTFELFFHPADLVLSWSLHQPLGFSFQFCLPPLQSEMLCILLSCNHVYFSLLSSPWLLLFLWFIYSNLCLGCARVLPSFYWSSWADKLWDTWFGSVEELQVWYWRTPPMFLRQSDLQQKEWLYSLT